MTLFSEPVNGMGIVIMYDLVGDRVGGQDTVGVCGVCVYIKRGRCTTVPGGRGGTIPDGEVRRET